MIVVSLVTLAKVDCMDFGSSTQHVGGMGGCRTETFEQERGSEFRPLFGKGGTTVSFSLLELSASLVRMLASNSKDAGKGKGLCDKPCRPTCDSHVSRL